MDLAAALIDLILHVDVHLTQFVQMHGAWVYALLFAIVFVETGLVVMPFLPGDSMLFIVGALAAAGLGNISNSFIGRAIGHRVFTWKDSRWFKRKAFDQAHAFYERYGGITIVVTRFIPF